MSVSAMKQTGRTHRPQDEPPIGPRILALIRASPTGLTSREIAEALDIPRRKIQTELTRIRARADCPLRVWWGPTPYKGLTYVWTEQSP